MILANELHHDQRSIVAHADASADSAESIVRSAWLRILDILNQSQHGNYHLILHSLRPVLAALGPQLVSLLAGSFATGARRTYVQAQDQIRALIPQRATGLREGLSEIVDAGLHLFAPLDQTLLHRILYGGDWVQRLAVQTSLASPDVIASIIAAGWQQGQTQMQIARQLLPLMQGVQTSARRVARTEFVRIAHEAQIDAWEKVEPDGYQVHAVHGNPNSRWWHLKRSGRKYYRRPKIGQDGFDKLPRPPHEAPDASERPPGTPEIAFNCLCWIAPFFE